MIKRIVEVTNLVDGIDDIGVITSMYNANAEETHSVDDAVQLVVKYRDKGFMNVDATCIDIHTVH